MRVRAARVVAALCLVHLAGAARAQEMEETLVKKGVLRGDQYLAGAVVDVHGRVEGDLVMVGGQAGLDGIATGDVWVIGGVVHVGGVVGDDVRALGGQVVVQGMVRDELLAAGGDVTVTRNSRIGGRALLGGRRILALGDFDGDLVAAADHVEIGGEVHGAARIRSDDVVVGPEARIDGDLVVRGARPPRIAEGARVRGRVIVEALPGLTAAGWIRAAIGAFAMQLGLLLVAWAFLVFTPDLARTATALEWRRTPMAAGIGLAVAFGLPLVAALLAVSVVGLPLAAGVAAVWVLVLVLGYATTGLCLGAWIRARVRGAGAAPARLGERLLFALLSLVVLRAAAALPWVGPLVVAGALLAGTGAVARAVQEANARSRVSRAPPGPAAA